VKPPSRPSPKTKTERDAPPLVCGATPRRAPVGRGERRAEHLHARRPATRLWSDSAARTRSAVVSL
jgi:hypothetical protein